MAHHQQQGAGQQGVYEDLTLTRSTDGGEGAYANLSDLHVLDKFSYSGDFDDPSSLLDRHPFPPEFVPGQNDPPYSELDDFVDSFSDTDSEYEEEPVGAPITQIRDKRDTTIDIVGSLCLQGILQGLVPSSVEDNPTASTMPILPSSILMTSNLEVQKAALDELSVMVVAQNLEIVPETPYDPNNTVSGKGKSSKTEPHPHRRTRISVTTRPHSESITSKVDVRPTTVTYIDNIVRAPPLPPIDELLPESEIKRYKVIENLLESEAAFLTSLNIAIEVYRKPLKNEVSTELSTDDIKHLFGPLSAILEHHELFFAALSEQTKNWSPSKQIGDIFLASFSRKDVVRHYRRYVNNFTVAMNILEKSIKRKQRFYDFLKKQMTASGIQLSLQALLLKPIQRFFQYLLFLKDLIKYTPTSHPDSVVLEMAEARIEGIATHLNEAKRNSEQLTIVKYLNTTLEKLPHNLILKNQILHRQDMIQRTILKDGKWIFKERLLFLFDYLIVCCSVKQPKSRRQSVGKRSSVIEAEQVITKDSSTPHLKFKWSCPVTDVELVDPDYMKETNTIVIGGSQAENAELRKKYDELKDEMKKLNQDFELLYRIGGLMASLSRPYEGLNVTNVQNSCRVLQRKLEQSHELIRSCCEPTRVDITITGSDGMRNHEIFIFESKGAREDWVREFQLAKLRQSPANKQTWINDEDDPDDIELELSEDCEGSPEQGLGAKGEERGKEVSLPNESLPLVVDCMRLSHNSDLSTVECATSVGNNRVWFATGNNNGAFISVVRCFLPSPLLVETFPVESSKILCMKNISTTVSVDRSSQTVWIGSQCGKLFLYDAGTNKYLQSAQLNDSVLCIEKYRNRAFVGTASGYVYVYTRPKGEHWDLNKIDHRIPLSNHPIQCFCPVSNKLWIGVQKSFVILDMVKLHIEVNHKVTNDDISVKKMERAGAGVWIALSRGSILYLFHKDTLKPIQEINIRGALSNIIANASIEDKFKSLNNIYITSLLAEAGYLWIGTSTGATLVYRIPPLNGLPILNERPFLAGDGHNGTVRVLVSVQTQTDKTTARFDQFLTDERQRNIGSFVKKPEPVTGAMPSKPAIVNPSSTATPEIDSSALPRVEQVIKKLEAGKEFLKSQSEDLPVPRRPVPKPRLKKLKKKAALETAMKAGAKEAKEKKGEGEKEVKEGNTTPTSAPPTTLPILPTEPKEDSSVVSPVMVTVTGPADYEVPENTQSISGANTEEDHLYEIPNKPPQGYAVKPPDDTGKETDRASDVQPQENPTSTLKSVETGALYETRTSEAEPYEVPTPKLRKKDIEREQTSPTRKDEQPYEVPMSTLKGRDETLKAQDHKESSGKGTIKKKEEEEATGEAAYDEVPREDIELSGGEEQETVKNLKSSSSEVLITPSRYEGNQILSGEAIYEHIHTATISMTIPGRQSLPTSSSSFVFSGGDGLVNFRQGQQASSVLQQFLTTHAGGNSLKDSCPCIITFQVPETNNA